MVLFAIKFSIMCDDIVICLSAQLVYVLRVYIHNLFFLNRKAIFNLHVIQTCNFHRTNSSAAIQYKNK